MRGNAPCECVAVMHTSHYNRTGRVSTAKHKRIGQDTDLESLVRDDMGEARVGGDLLLLLALHSPHIHPT